MALGLVIATAILSQITTYRKYSCSLPKNIGFLEELSYCYLISNYYKNSLKELYLH